MLMPPLLMRAPMVMPMLVWMPSMWLRRTAPRSRRMMSPRVRDSDLRLRQRQMAASVVRVDVDIR
jgi:hypothetical protein